MLSTGLLYAPIMGLPCELNVGLFLLLSVEILCVLSMGLLYIEPGTFFVRRVSDFLMH